MDIARNEGVNAGIVFGNREKFEAIDVRTTLFPVIGVFRHDRADAGFEFLQLEGTGAVPLGEIGRAIGNDHEVMQCQDGRQVCIRVCQRDLDGALVDRLEAGHLGGDLGDLRTDGRFKVTLQRIDHVIGGQCLAVMEGDAGTQLHGPGLGVLRFDGFGQLHLGRAGNIEEAQPVIERAATNVIRRKRGFCGVERVGRGGGPSGRLQRAAGNGSGRQSLRGAAENGRTGGKCYAAGQHHVKQLSPRRAATDSLFNGGIVRAGPICNPVTHGLPLLYDLLKWHLQ